MGLFFRGFSGRRRRKKSFFKLHHAFSVALGNRNNKYIETFILNSNNTYSTYKQGMSDSFTNTMDSLVFYTHEIFFFFSLSLFFHISLIHKRSAINYESVSNLADYIVSGIY